MLAADRALLETGLSRAAEGAPDAYAWLRAGGGARRSRHQNHANFPGMPSLEWRLGLRTVHRLSTARPLDARSSGLMRWHAGAVRHAAAAYSDSAAALSGIYGFLSEILIAARRADCRGGESAGSRSRSAPCGSRSAALQSAHQEFHTGSG
jgi:hypothetical protein